MKFYFKKDKQATTVKEIFAPGSFHSTFQHCES